MSGPKGFESISEFRTVLHTKRMTKKQLCLRYILDANSKEVLSETYCGSLLYTAPEVLRGIPYEPSKSDMWALGVLIFTMLNKCVPFDNRCGIQFCTDRTFNFKQYNSLFSNVTILYQHQVKRRYKFRERICGSVTIEVKRLIRNLLEPIPKRRLNIDEVVDNAWYKMDPRFKGESVDLLKIALVENIEQNS